MQVNVIAAPHPNPPNAKKGPNNKKQMCFLESKNMEIQKNALTLWRHTRQTAKTLFRDAAFYARPANYHSPIHLRKTDQHRQTKHVKETECLTGTLHQTNTQIQETPQ